MNNVKIKDSIRNTRLAHDYEEICNISKAGDILSFCVLKGEIPYVEAYEVTIQINSIISVKPEYRHEHTVLIELHSDYPINAPKVMCLTKPFPFHPNWYASGLWDYGWFVREEGLGSFLVRLMRSLQFDPLFVDLTSVSNREAAVWYEKNKNNGLFPCDKQTLPTSQLLKKITTNIVEERSVFNSTIRNIRLQNDYTNICNMVDSDNRISFKIIEGCVPRVETYEFRFIIKSIVGSEPTYRTEHRIRIALPSGYPAYETPSVICLTKPYPFHPNWCNDGTWCGIHGIRHQMGLGDYLIRIIHTLRFDPYYTDLGDGANPIAKEWWLLHKDKGIFPCDV